MDDKNDDESDITESFVISAVIIDVINGCE